MNFLGIVLCSYFVVVWGVVFFLSKGVRRHVVAASLIAAFIGPLLEYWHLQDYWHPPYLVSITLGGFTAGLEDVLFSFSFAGSCLGFFLMKKELRASLKPMSYQGITIFALLAFLGLLLTGGLVVWVGMNSLYAVTTAALAIGVFIFSQRIHWIKSGIVAAGTAALVMWSFYKLFALIVAPDIFAEFWKPEALSGTMVFSVPVEEIVWAAAFGFVIGPMYRYSLELSWKFFGPREIRD